MVWVLIILAAILVAIMFWSISNFENSCTGECEQGRKCNCAIGRTDDE